MNMHYDEARGAKTPGIDRWPVGDGTRRTEPGAEPTDCQGLEGPELRMLQDWVSPARRRLRCAVLDTGNTAARTAGHPAEVRFLPRRRSAAMPSRVMCQPRTFNACCAKPAGHRPRGAGMPVGSPGMDGPAYGGRKDAYDVLLIGKNGSSTVYHRIDHPSTLLRGDMPCSISTQTPAIAPVLAIALRRGVPHHRRCRRVFPAQGAHGTCCRLSPLPAAGGLSADAPVHAPWSQPRRTRSCRASGRKVPQPPRSRSNKSRHSHRASTRRRACLLARLRPAAITRHQQLTAEGTCHYEFTQQVFRT